MKTPPLSSREHISVRKGFRPTLYSSGFLCGERLCSFLPTPPCIPSVLSASLGCHSFDDHLASNQEGGKSKNVVNLGAIRQGMKRFQFLLNCCEPGTIPDASILAAALDLVSHVLVCFYLPSESACVRGGLLSFANAVCARTESG